ncbi:unnamed protein product [Owenia fusiformis]|uniref:Uncharacterized protein n=1 Tax=Owenia fusiformis TaxID=6347 RepID=A0A8S4PXP2_OWEFU|nr:unnamed protein product [Owenia fusiformis]
MGTRVLALGLKFGSILGHHGKRGKKRKLTQKGKNHKLVKVRRGQKTKRSKAAKKTPSVETLPYGGSDFGGPKRQGQTNPQPQGQPGQSFVGPQMFQATGQNLFTPQQNLMSPQ